MSYINLAIALFTGVAAIYTLCIILRAALSSTATFRTAWGLPLNAAFFAILAALSVWNFNLAVAA